MNGMIVPFVVTCRKCNHTWIPRKMAVQKCPWCQSKKWNQVTEKLGDLESKTQESKATTQVTAGAAE